MFPFNGDGHISRKFSSFSGGGVILMRGPLKEGRETVCKSVSLSVPMFHAQRMRLQIESRRRRRRVS